jgi:hypothetical protein
MGVDR